MREKWLSPTDIGSLYRFSRAKSYRLLKKYLEEGGEHIRIGNQTRVPEANFTAFLKRSK
jgi:hypothetical protein